MLWRALRPCEPVGGVSAATALPGARLDPHSEASRSSGYGPRIRTSPPLGGAYMTTAARPSSCYPLERAYSLERTSDRPMRPACRIEARIVLGMQARSFSYKTMRRRVVFNFNNLSSSRRPRPTRAATEATDGNSPKGKGIGHSPT